MLTYVEQLKQMSNENLLTIALSRNDYVPGYRDAIKAELLSRPIRNPMDENCGSCKHSTFGTSEQGKNIWNCKNKESFLYDAYVNKTIHCTFWEGGKE